jgi:hypothetical protein
MDQWSFRGRDKGIGRPVRAQGFDVPLSPEGGAMSVVKLNEQEPKQ